MADVRWALTLPFAGVPLHDHAPLIERAESLGYQDVWSGETANGFDGFTPLALAATCTTEMRLVTGIVNPFTRGPGLLAQSAAALQDLSQGRFVLGLGASSNVIVQRFNDIPFEKPLSKVREAVERLRPALSVPAEKGFGGLRLESPVQQPVPIVLAALRERMLRLAGEVADGVFSNFLPVSGAQRVVSVAREAGGEDFEIACRFFLMSEEALPLARVMFANYGSVGVYSDFFRELGWGEALSPMVEAYTSGDRQGAIERVPEELMREIFVIGSPEEQKARLAEFEAAGITTFVLTPIAGPDDLPGLLEALAR
jgi:probable F420-dependent oxidoreductase